MPKTYLYNNHIKLEAETAGFADRSMPVQYTGIIEKHVPHMGKILGVQSLDYLQVSAPRNIAKLEDKQALYCQMTNEKGGIIDDLIIYKIENNRYSAVVNASRIEADYSRLTKHAENFNVKVENKSDIYSMAEVQCSKSFYITGAELLNSSADKDRKEKYTGRDRNRYRSCDAK